MNFANFKRRLLRIADPILRKVRGDHRGFEFTQVEEGGELVFVRYHLVLSGHDPDKPEEVYEGDLPKHLAEYELEIRGSYSDDSPRANMLYMSVYGKGSGEREVEVPYSALEDASLEDHLDMISGFVKKEALTKMPDMDLVTNSELNRIMGDRIRRQASNPTLKDELIKMGYKDPSLRKHLRPLIDKL